MGEMISIIVPVYKVEDYLPECLDSLVNQTYENIEIILVDDASPDDCGEICDRYAERDSRVKCIHQENNAGQAVARNTGMEAARGEYLFFVDSDDWLSEDALETLYEGLKRYQADCCVGACVTVLEGPGGSRTVQGSGQRGENVRSAREAMEHVFLSGSAAWNRLCKKEKLVELRFRPNRINDDESFILYAYKRMDKIVFLDRETYYYRKRANSITTSAFSVKMMDCVHNSRENLDFVKKKMPELVPAAEYKYYKGMLWCYVNMRKLKGDERAKQLCGQLHREIRRQWKMALFNPHLELKMKLLAMICLL